MERASTRKGLKVEHYSEKIEQAKVFIRKRMNNEAPSLKTSFKKLNDALFEGFEWNRIVTIAGLSASGESLLLSQIRRDVVDYNPNEKLNILAFEMEMLGVDQVSRDISSKTDLTTRELYSAGSKLTEQQYDTVCKTADKMKYYPIFIVDDVGTVDEIVHTILNFVEENKLIEENRGLICTFDHSLLVKGTVGSNVSCFTIGLYCGVPKFSIPYLLREFNLPVDSLVNAVRAPSGPEGTAVKSSEIMFLGSLGCLIRPAFIYLFSPREFSSSAPSPNPIRVNTPSLVSV